MDRENFVISDGIQIAPFRSLGEFLTNCRFELPTFNDLPKWNKRIVTNLLYFQSNYIVVFLTIFFLIGLFFVQDIALGAFAVSVALGTYLFALTTSEKIKNFRAERPYVALAIMVIAGCYFIFQLGSVFVLVYTTLVPLLLILIHASLHLRSLTAKVNLELENIRFRDTLMANILSTLGVPLK